MKITDFCLVFIVIFFPVFLIMGYHVQDQRNVRFTELKYVTALRTAVQDAGSMLNVNERQEFESGYGSAKFLKRIRSWPLIRFTIPCMPIWGSKRMRLPSRRWTVTFRP